MCVNNFKNMPKGDTDVKYRVNALGNGGETLCK